MPIVNESEAVVESPPAETPAVKGFRWRLVPAAFLMLLGIAGMVLVAIVFGALAIGVAKDYDFFKGPNSPELSQRSLTGMAILFGCNLLWFAAGRLLWKRKYLAGLLLAVVAYPLASEGVNRMFSSSVEHKTSPPVDRQPPMRRFDEPRRRRPPPLAAVPVSEVAPAIW